MTFDSRYKFNSMAVSGIVIFMKIHVDAEKCQGHNRCYALAPELFDVDDYGNAVVIGEALSPPNLKTALVWHWRIVPNSPSRFPNDCLIPHDFN